MNTSKAIDFDMPREWATSVSCRTDKKQLYIKNLQNIELCLRLARKYPDTVELILDEPNVNVEYYRSLKAFGKLRKIRLENANIVQGSVPERTKEDASIPKICFAKIQMLDQGFAGLLNFFGATELELYEIAGVTKGFWQDFSEIASRLISFSVRQFELSSLDFWGNILPKMTHLEHLSLSAFGSNPILLQDMNVACLKNLRDLEISNVGIVALPHGFSQLKNLKNLSLLNLPMTELIESDEKATSSDGSSLTVDISGLESLNISGTNIYQLPDNNEMRALYRLHANYTKIQYLPDCFFTETLKDLQITNSSLSVLPESSFCKLTALEFLDVSYTQLKELPLHASCQNSLRGLYLRGIDDLHRLPSWVAECPKLAELDLRHLQLNDSIDSLLQQRMKFVERNPNIDISHSKKPPEQNSTNEVLNVSPIMGDRICIVYIDGIRLDSLDPRLLLLNDTELFHAYVQAQKEPINKGNLIFLGDFSAENRDLVEYITGTLPSEWESCSGVDILEDSFAFENIINLAACGHSRHITVRMMKMSGYPSAQFLHPLFFTDHSLYVIILNGRNESLIQGESTWWARLIEAYAPNSKIIFAIRQDVAAIKGLNLTLLTREAVTVFEPEVVYLSGNQVDSYQGLCRRIVNGIHSLLLAKLRLPVPWIQMLSHFEQMLETRMILHREFFNQLMDRYIFHTNDSDGELRLQDYLLTFEGKTTGRMAHEFIKSSEDVLYHTSWLGEGLYRLLEYARDHHGKIVNIRCLWEFLIDAAQREYSYNQTRMLLNFCEQQWLCYYQERDNTYVFPSFTSEQNCENGNMRHILIDNNTVRYIIQCPVLSNMMIAQMICRIVRESPNCRKLSGQSELYLSSNISGEFLMLGQVGASVKLHLYFLDIKNKDPDSKMKKNVFSAIKSVLKQLPAHLLNQYQIYLERSIGNHADLRSVKLAEIPIEELTGYNTSGRSTYFCGRLNQNYDIGQMGFLPSPMWDLEDSQND